MHHWQYFALGSIILIAPHISPKMARILSAIYLVLSVFYVFRAAA